MYSSAKRITDGLLTSVVNSPNIQDEAAAIANAVVAIGGVAADWQLVELTSEQYQAVMAGLPGRPFLVAGVVTTATPPGVSLSNGTVQADGIATITLTVTIPGYAGPVKVTINPPSGSSTTETLTAVAGVASDAISTDYLGLHSITVETTLQGVAFASFEGVA
jgi:hypothetical protein